MKLILQILWAGLLMFASACDTDNSLTMETTTKPHLRAGTWRAVLQLSPDVELPFNFDITDMGHLYIRNAQERLNVTEISIEGDLVEISLPIFGTSIRAKLSSDGDSLQGVWINPNKNKYEIPFRAYFNQKERFPIPKEKALFKADGKWEVTFSPNTKNSAPAIGVFEQKGHLVTGTFLTETGDYRYLEGQIEGDKIVLSCFDGSHAFLFTATGRGDTIENGIFYSGNHWQEPWQAKRNDSFQLADPDTLTYLKEGHEQLSFAFLNDRGDTVRLSDPQFKGKVLIVQIMGTWCPNCMDETVYFVELYKKYKAAGLEIIAIDYEIRNDYETFKSNIARMRKSLGVEYICLFGGSSKKSEAAATLPMLNHILSYPTTIFIDRLGIVQKIQTGFNGPGTGELYEAYMRKTNRMVQQLLK